MKNYTIIYFYFIPGSRHKLPRYDNDFYDISNNGNQCSAHVFKRPGRQFLKMAFSARCSMITNNCH